MLIFQLLALAGLIAGLYGIYMRFAETKRRAIPADNSPIKGNLANGIKYAFTTGMMPWAKESTRIHMIAYLRGIGFHIGIFAVWLTTLFITVAGLAVLNQAFMIPMYLVSAITFVYVPFGKIRHCLYFFFSRLFFGKFFGRRAVFPHPAEIG